MFKRTFCLVILQLAFSMSLAALMSSRQMTREEAFDDFLDMIDAQNVKESSDRASQYAYIKTAHTGSGKLMNQNRHGETFVKCMESDPERNVTRNTRCFLEPGRNQPACHVAYDYNTQRIVAGCFDIGGKETTCSDECKPELQSVFSAPGTEMKATVIGSCCCSTDMCNEKAKLNLEAAYAKFVSKKNGENHHHHHHHHHQRDNTEDTANFWDTVRSRF